MKILVTGWAGFIGSNLTRMLLDRMSDEDHMLGIDSFTYAARPEWVFRNNSTMGIFEPSNTDLRNAAELERIIAEFKPDQVYHLAAESHVCNSIAGPRAFAETNFIGTFNLLESLRKIDFKGRLIHVSTDEAFGSLDYGEASFTEATAIDPRSPYSASKAASDLMVKAYVHTYGLDAVITRCTNNYGPNQHEEKLIPKTILALLNNEDVTVYGTGDHVRDWIFVDDHCKGLIDAMRDGKKGEIYCIGSGLELKNKEVILKVYEEIEFMGINARLTCKSVDARPTDDRRYSVDTTKAYQDFKFAAGNSDKYFRYQLRKTIRWYQEEMKKQTPFHGTTMGDFGR